MCAHGWAAGVVLECVEEPDCERGALQIRAPGPFDDPASLEQHLVGLTVALLIPLCLLLRHALLFLGTVAWTTAMAEAAIDENGD